MDEDELRDRFRPHPADGEATRMHAAVYSLCGDVAVELNKLLPDGREKSLVVTHLEDASMWANKAIARGRSGGEADLAEEEKVV